MAAKTAMSKTQLETLRHKLQNERSRVMRVLQDSVARAPAEERERTLLAEIDHALAKFDAGTYGVSEKTGTPISFERLNALPWARQDTDE